MVEQEPSGVWVGHVDYVHIGGNCAEATTRSRSKGHCGRSGLGGDFFAYRTTGAYPCYLHGHVRTEGVSGF